MKHHIFNNLVLFCGTNRILHREAYQSTFIAGDRNNLNKGITNWYLYIPY
jgi:hypothetical protein